MSPPSMRLAIMVLLALMVIGTYATNSNTLDNALGLEYGSLGIPSVPAQRYLKINSRLYSKNGKYFAVMQSDRNFCVYDVAGAYVWCTGTSGFGQNSVAYLGSDGRLQIRLTPPSTLTSPLPAARSCGFYKSSYNRIWNLAAIPELYLSASWGYWLNLCGVKCQSGSGSQLACQSPDNIWGLGSLTGVTIDDLSENQIRISAGNGDVTSCSGPRTTVVIITAEVRSNSTIASVTENPACNYTYDVRVPHSVQGCPNRCSGRGTCNLGTSVCMCASGASGADCSTNSYVPGTNYVNPLDGRTWNLAAIPEISYAPDYSYTINLAGASCSIGNTDVACQDNLRGLGKVSSATITPISASSIKIRAVNGTVDWGCGDIGRAATITLVTSSNPTSSVTNYAGGCDYSFTISVASTIVGCPNGCSGYGTCSASMTCQCNTGYSGDDCGSVWHSDNMAGIPGTRLILSNYGSLFLLSDAGAIVWQSPKDYQGIVSRFGPIFYYHPSEGYPPMTVDYYLSKVGIDRYEGWNSVTPYKINTVQLYRTVSGPGTLVGDKDTLALWAVDLQSWLNTGHNYNNDDESTGYVAYLTDRSYSTSQPWTSSASPLPDGILRNYVVINDLGYAIELTYWQIFGYDSVPGNMWQSGIYGNHQADWTYVRIRIEYDASFSPLQIYDYSGYGVRYNFHGNYKTFRWTNSQVERDGEQVKVYVALGTHEYHWHTACSDDNGWPYVDQCSDSGARRDSRQGTFELYFWDGPSSNFVQKALYPTTGTQLSPSPGWLQYKGRWGNAASGCLSSNDDAGSCKRVSGPNGMNRAGEYVPLSSYDS